MIVSLQVLPEVSYLFCPIACFAIAGVKDGVGVNEQKIASCPTYCIDANYYMFRSQISSPIALNKGDRIYLRIRTVGMIL